MTSSEFPKEKEWDVGKIDTRAPLAATEVYEGEILPDENADNLHRRLGNRQIQLIAIGTHTTSDSDQMVLLLLAC